MASQPVHDPWRLPGVVTYIEPAERRPEIRKAQCRRQVHIPVSEQHSIELTPSTSVRSEVAPNGHAREPQESPLEPGSSHRSRDL